MWCKSGLWSWKLNETHLFCERHFCKQSRSEDTLCTDIKCPSRTSSIKNERNKNILLRFSSEAPRSSGRLPSYYMKFSRHEKNREIKVSRKLRDSYYVHNQERPSLLPLKRLQITFFTLLINFQCKWMLWSIDSRTIIHLQAWTACGHCENCLVFLIFT